MGTTITLDQRRYKAAAKRARELCKTPEQHIESLIEADTLTFEKVLMPVCKKFRRSGVGAKELYAAINEARRAIRLQ
jgi:hypothetical protein